jgi:hypothetical protein
MDEAHLVIDSANSWMKQPESREARLDIGAVVEDVNFVSDIQISL